MSISIHRPNTKRHNSEKSFSFFLAGIVDGGGRFSAIPQLVICFAENDVSIAYFIKSQIGFGIVRKVKNKKAFVFVLSGAKGLEKVCKLLHNKLQRHKKILQYNTCFARLNVPQKTTNASKPFVLSENAWFSGFFCSDGSFQIKILQRPNRKPEVRLVIQIDQKKTLYCIK